MPVYLLCQSSSSSSYSKNNVLRSSELREKMLAPLKQELILPEDQEYTCGLYRTAEGEIRTITFRRWLQDGLTYAAEVAEIPAIEKLLVKIAGAVGLVGAAPLMVATGLAMSPAVTATFPWLVRLFGGYQSARTVHFVAFVALLLFVLVHVVMVVKSGFRHQIRAMTVGD